MQSPVLPLCDGEVAQGGGKTGVVTCFKHFPGAGDGSDFHKAIPITLERLENEGLGAFVTAVENDADMVMTSVCTFPAFDDEVLFARGTSVA